MISLHSTALTNSQRCKPNRIIAILFTLMCSIGWAHAQNADNGAVRINGDTAQLYINTSAWADAHYLINNGPQQNVRMPVVNGVNRLDISGLNNQDQIVYWFTYWDNGANGAFDTAVKTYTHQDAAPPPPPAGNNIALGSSATGSTNLQAASLAVDGDGSTRWESNFNTDPSWLTLDLGAAYALSSVTIDWEAANAAHYQLQGSNDANNWSVLIEATGGSFGDRTDTHAVSGTFRYVRMYGLTRSVGNDWGYSIYEFKVYGSLAPSNNNIALGKSATGSTTLQAAGLAFDGDPTTRWESNFQTDPSWLRVDLGATYDLSAVSIDWEYANAANYQIQGSNNGNSWTTLYNYSGGQVGDRTDDLTLSGSYRYLRMFGTARSAGNDWGYSIFEMRVFGTLSNGPSDPDSDNDGVPDSSDQCPNTAPGVQVDANGCPVTTPPPSTVTPLYNSSTPLEPDTQVDTGNALITRFSDRPRTRHAREDQFQSYDHYIKFYFEHRASNIEIIDTVAKGGNTITMNVRTLWPLSDSEAENRWWYLGRNTVAEYSGGGIMQYVGFDGTYYNYTKSDNLNRQFNREIRIGDRLEFEISQFSRNDIPRGQANYYGTTFLYIVGKGIVPWYTENAGEFVPGGGEFQEDSREIPASYWLGGNTTIHYQYTDEPNDHFMQMATNLGYDNGQKFLEGRRILHSSFIDGQHDEDPENGVLNTVAGLAGSQPYIKASCSGCHERNGGAPVAPNNELLDRWVFKTADANGNPHPQYGKVLQPRRVGGAGEGDVSIAFWSNVANGLRAPNYQFQNGAPERFSARIAPRLVGLGLLEAIPESTIESLEDPNDANGDGISGRANRVADPANPQVTRIGRFGWKAGTSSIRHQVVSALNTDMGVRTSLMPNLDCGSNQSGCSNNSPMLPDAEIDKLVTYLAGLGVRPQRGWESGFEDQTIVYGKQVFSNTGCAGCHTPTLQTSPYHPMAEARNQTIHPYSDMLLHDMGDGLADNLGDGDASGREWRTTPLWGLGLHACVTGGVTNPSGAEGGEICTPHHAYLHDGRARSIEEAILWHGGEGANSRANYQALSASDKNALLRFLESL